MINAAVIGLGWWGQNIIKTLRDSDVIRPALAVDPLDRACNSFHTRHRDRAPVRGRTGKSPDRGRYPLHAPGTARRPDHRSGARGAPRVLREAVVHDGRGRGIGTRRRKRGWRATGNRSRTPVRARRDRDAQTVCGWRIRQSAAAGGKFQPGPVSEITARQLAAVEGPQPGRPAFGHRHSHGRSFDFAAWTADQRMGAALAIGQSVRERRHAVDRARL